jgi:hypothetical protein
MYGTFETQTDIKTEKKVVGTRVHSDRIITLSATRSSQMMGSHIEAKISDDLKTQTDEQGKAKLDREPSYLDSALQQVSTKRTIKNQSIFFIIS